ncbi:MAG: PAS domain S-box protein [Nitrospirae bacterium]|uniref:two-component system sensor histidine kinase NtrB n=1 Tax=Candidatus Magnetobacterium casense TaxID=1455061 RepID=UPI00058E4763|nr:ATP-binding protein [Candidatus Magnetobacterium casensis]MBF0337559.1 PAS domain S-box protein [Nitrospirota bacterium]
MHQQQTKKIRALIGSRVFIAYLLVASFYVYNKNFLIVENSRFLSYFAAFIFLLTIVYLLLLKKLTRGYFVFAYIQILVDIALIMLFILITGGIESWFSFMLLVNVIGAGITLGRRPILSIAAISALTYGSVIVMQFYGIIGIHFSKVLNAKDFFYNIFANIMAMFLVAFLGRHLLMNLEKTSKTLEKRESDFRDLYAFHLEVIENIPGGLSYADTAGNIMLFNRPAEQITGLKKTQAIEKTIWDVFEFIPAPIKTGRLSGCITIASDEKIIELKISKHRNDIGEVMGYVITFEDHTKLAEMEREMKEKEKLAAIGEMAANIAHEIRNPLSAIRSSVEMLKEGSLDETKRKRIMDIAIVEMDRMNKIITDFLTYSSPRPPEFKTILLSRTLGETIEMLRALASTNSNVTINTNIAHEVYIDADDNKLRQVFWNLGLNAIQACQDNGEISVEVKQLPEFVTIIFKDNGAGIEPNMLKKIFYPFFTTKRGGGGLGLAMVYRIVHEHSGRINVMSTVGKGSVFEVFLPYDRHKQ